MVGLGGSRHGRGRTPTAGHPKLSAEVGFGEPPCGLKWREAAPDSTGQEMFVYSSGGNSSKNFRRSVILFTERQIQQLLVYLLVYLLLYILLYLFIAL